MTKKKKFLRMVGEFESWFGSEQSRNIECSNDVLHDVFDSGLFYYCTSRFVAHLTNKVCNKETHE